MYRYERRLNYRNAFLLSSILLFLFIVISFIVTNMMFDMRADYDKQIDEQQTEIIKLSNDKTQLSNQLMIIKDEYNDLLESDE